MGSPTDNDWVAFKSTSNKDKASVLYSYLVEGYNMIDTAHVALNDYNDMASQRVSNITRCYGFHGRNGGTYSGYKLNIKDIEGFVKKYPNGCDDKKVFDDYIKNLLANRDKKQQQPKQQSKPQQTVNKSSSANARKPNWGSHDSSSTSSSSKYDFDDRYGDVGDYTEVDSTDVFASLATFILSVVLLVLGWNIGKYLLGWGFFGRLVTSIATWFCLCIPSAYIIVAILRSIRKRKRRNNVYKSKPRSFPNVMGDDDDDDDMLYPVDEYENVKIYNHMSDDEFNELTQEEKDSLKDIMRPDYDFSKFLK